MGLLVNHPVPTPLGFDAPQAYVSNQCSISTFKEHNPDNGTWALVVSTTMFVSYAKGEKHFNTIPIQIVIPSEIITVGVLQTLLYEAMVAQHFPAGVSDESGVSDE